MLGDTIKLTFVLVGLAALVIGLWPLSVVCGVLFLACNDLDRR